MRTSCISHPPRSPFLMLRAEYIRICGGDHCAAVVLALFEFWTNAIWDSNPTDDDDNCIQSSLDEIKSGLMNSYSRDAIRASIEALLGWRFIKSFPNAGGATEYLLCVERVQRTIDGDPPVGKPTGTSRKTDTPPIGKPTGHSIKEVGEEYTQKPECVSDPQVDDSMDSSCRTCGHLAGVHAHEDDGHGTGCQVLTCRCKRYVLLSTVTQPLGPTDYSPELLEVWLKAEYPSGRRSGPWIYTLAQVVTSQAVEDRLRNGLRTWKLSEQWTARKVIPSLHRFLLDFRFDDPPDPEPSREAELSERVAANLRTYDGS